MKNSHKDALAVKEVLLRNWKQINDVCYRKTDVGIW